MKKIMIIGCCGAGKSILARKLHQLTSLPLFHLDQLYFSPNWVEMEKEKWEKIVIAVAQKEEWIIDGNYGGTMDFRMREADTIIFLDYPRWICMYRVIKRILKHYGRKRPDMAEGCKERFDLAFLHYVFTFKYVKRPTILRRLSQIQGQQKALVFKTDQETDQYLAQIKAKIAN